MDLWSISIYRKRREIFMSKILVSGLVNTETTVRVKQFPIEYFPIDYPFFGVNTRVSGVAYNIAKALHTLSDEVRFVSMLGDDFAGKYVTSEIEAIGVSTEYVKPLVRKTASSVVLYDETGKRQIYCDLKDIQEQRLVLEPEIYEDCDIIVACNINFNRELIKRARACGKIVATDVHVLGNIYDSYNADFMRCANILFLSDENIWGDHRQFLWDIAHTYHNDIIVVGRGSKGAALYDKKTNTIEEFAAVSVGNVVNTVGAGDALFSSFVHYYAKGLEPKEALMKAQIFASYKIGFDGASEGFASPEEIEKLYQDHVECNHWL